jgi:hypothetical protein
MGSARWSPEDWDKYVSTTATKSASEIFSSYSLHEDLDPKEIKYRESCDSVANPLSTPIIVAVDVTGSMGVLAENLIRKGLGVLIEEIYDRKPVSDPHLMCMALGDAWYDQAPLQATQFEADIRLADQLSKFWIEGGGGGNNYESYNLPWYFAATRTKCDAFLKRQKKGYLFTVGDEPPPPELLAKHASKFLGDNLQHDISTREILTMVSKTWEVFHIMIAEGSYFRSAAKQTQEAWRKLLGQRAITLTDHNNLAELIVSTIEVNEGADTAKVAASWSGGTALVIANSLKSLQKGLLQSGKGVTRL